MKKAEKQDEQQPQIVKVDNFDVVTREQMMLVFENRGRVRLRVPETQADLTRRWLAVFSRSGYFVPVDLTQGQDAFLVVG